MRKDVIAPCGSEISVRNVSGDCSTRGDYAAQRWKTQDGYVEETRVKDDETNHSRNSGWQ